MYDGFEYPDFLSGGAYVMSADVAVELYSTAMTLPIFHLEDVFITGNTFLISRKNDSFQYTEI